MKNQTDTDPASLPACCWPADCPRVRSAPRPPPAGPAVEAATAAILGNPKVIKTLDDIKADDDRALAEQKRITEIPAPPYKEKVRAEYYLKRFVELGFKDASIDAEGNVIALRKGSGGGPKLVVSAHLDTVFPEGTDVTVKEKDGVILAPGIGDDSRGLAALLSLIQAMNANDIATVGDVLFVGTVGEEELGNLRGVKALFRDHADIDGFISIDGLGITRIVNQGTGSHRYEMIFHGPGGHSFQEFGLPSAIHAMGRAIAKISELQTPKRAEDHLHRRHRRWRHVGQRHRRRGQDGGRHALGLDRGASQTRSPAARSRQGRGAEENARWNSDKIAVEIKLIGDRPAGIVALDSPIVQATQRAVAVVTRAPRVTFAGSSTDSNWAMSRGIPAVTIGGGGEGGNWHSRNEWYKPVDAYFGPQNALLTILVLTGLEGVTKPALQTYP